MVYGWVYDVYEVASPQGWKKNPALVLDFYNQRRKEVLKALPNIAHKGIAALEDRFRCNASSPKILTTCMNGLVQRMLFTCMVRYLKCEVKTMNIICMKLREISCQATKPVMVFSFGLMWFGSENRFQ